MTTSPMPHPMNYGGPAQRNSGLSIGALICGIAAFITAWIPCINIFITPLVALAALILGIIGWVQASKDPSQKPLLAIIGIGLAVLSFVAIAVFYMLFSRALMEAGGQFGRTAIVQQYKAQADLIEQQARNSGVSDDVIESARSDFDAVLDAVPSDVMQLEQAERDLQAALDKFREALGQIPDLDADDDGN